MIERDLSTEEAESINDRVDVENIEPVGEAEWHEHGFDLTYIIDGKTYRLVYDRETYFTGIGYELIED